MRRQWPLLTATALLAAGVMWCRPYERGAVASADDAETGDEAQPEELTQYENTGPIFSFIPERRNWIRDFGRVPTVVSGSAEGEREMSDRGNGCIGLAGRQANHRARISSDTEVTLQVDAIGDSAGVSLALCDEAGCLCSGNGTELHTTLPRGVYEIFVSRYATADRSVQYVLQATPGPPGWTGSSLLGQGTLPPPVLYGREPQLLAPPAGGASGGVRMDAGSGPASLAGDAGGPRDASALGPGCVGFVGHAPDHIVHVVENTELTFRVRADEDTTLYVEGPNEERWCNDDAEGLNPAVRDRFEPGAYHVFVGRYVREGGTIPYELMVSR